jgi:nicotinamidase-related amidase
MALTQIDAVAALVVIDLQKGIVAAPMAHPAGEIVERTARLARSFREHGLPVILVNVAARPPGAPTLPSPSLRRPTGRNSSPNSIASPTTIR